MSWLTVDQREFKEEVRDLIDAVDTEPHGWERVLAINVERLVKAHSIAVTAYSFTDKICALLRAGGRDMAKRMPDAMRDKELTRLGAFLVGGAQASVGIGLLAGFVVLVVWTYERMAV